MNLKGITTSSAAASPAERQWLGAPPPAGEMPVSVERDLVARTRQANQSGLYPDTLQTGAPPPSGGSLELPGISKLGLQIFSGFYTAPTANIRNLLNNLAGWSFACIEVLALEYSRIQSRAYRLNTTDEQEDKELLTYSHWLPKILRNPNPKLSRSVIYRNKVRWWAATGNVFIYTPRDESGMPVAQWILPAHKMYVIPDKDKFVGGYRYFSPSGVIAFEPWEICHIYDPYPNADNILQQSYYGTGILEKAWKTIRVDNQTHDYLERLFANDAMPPILLKTPRRMEDAEYRQFVSRWEEKYGNPKDRGRWGLLEGGMDVITPNIADARLKFYEMNRQNAEAICAYFGVPLPYIVGDHQNKSTAEIVENKVRASTVESMAVLFDEEMNRHWQNYEIGIAEYHDPITTRDSEYEQKLLDLYMKYGVYTREEIRLREGNTAEPENGELLVPNNIVSIKTAQTAEPKTPIAAPPAKRLKIGRLISQSVPVASDSNGPTPQSDPAGYAVWKSWEDKSQKLSSKLEDAIADEFDDLRETVLKNFNKQIKAYRKSDEPTDNSYDELFDADEFEAALESATSKDLKDAILKVLDAAAQEVGDTDADVATDYGKALDATMDDSIDKITETSETVKSELRDLLKSMKDDPVSDIRDAIKEKFDYYSESRATTIAQTTSTTAVEGAKNRVYQANGFEKRWLCSFLPASRDAHIDAHGQISKNGVFHVGGESMEHPGGGEEPENNINCHCHTQAVKVK